MLLAASLLVSLAACGGKNSAAPTGQVVATVDGEEITAAELKMELGGATAPNPQAQKQLEQSALRAIVNRRLLASAAKKQKIDETPVYAMQQRKADEMTLIGAMEQKLAAAVPTPSQEEVDRYVAEHPDSYAQRKIFTVEQVVVPSISQAALKQMQPLTSLEQIEVLLDRNKIPHRRATGALDGAMGQADEFARIAALPAGEVFVVPAATGVLVNQIRGTRIEPLVGAAATTAARAVMKAQQTQELVRKQLQEIITAGAPVVKYNATYAPAPDKASAAAGAGGK